MKKKQNVYKRKMNFHFLNIIVSVAFSALLVYFFALIGYSVAKPFGKIGEVKIDASLGSEYDTTEPTEKEVSDQKTIKAYWFPEIEISNMETFERMLDRIGDDYNTAVIPMKIKGGKLNYNSADEGAAMAGANSELDINEIVNAVKSHGLKPAASLNTLNDNLYPEADKSSGFINKDSGTLWYDAAENKGGKAWLSPAAVSAGTYLSALTIEMISAGFEYIIATDAEYPQFSRIGLDAIGETVTNENRYLDLVDIVNKIAAAADSMGHDMWIEISAAEMFEGTCEVYQALMLKTDKTVLEINLDDFNSTVKCGNENVNFSGLSINEKIETICTAAETFIYKTSFIPEITGSRISAYDKEKIVETLESMGYDSYIIR